MGQRNQEREEDSQNLLHYGVWDKAEVGTLLHLALAGAWIGQVGHTQVWVSCQAPGSPPWRLQGGGDCGRASEHRALGIFLPARGQVSLASLRALCQSLCGKPP